MHSEEVVKLLIEHVPEGIKNRFKSVCAIRGRTMRGELIDYMKAVGSADPEALAVLISNLADDGFNLVKQGDNQDVENRFAELSVASEKLLEVYGYDTGPSMDELFDMWKGSIADMDVFNIPEDFGEYRQARLQEIEERTGEAATQREETAIEEEWEKIEERREELREKNTED